MGITPRMGVSSLAGAENQTLTDTEETKTENSESRSFSAPPRWQRQQHVRNPGDPESIPDSATCNALTTHGPALRLGHSDPQCLPSLAAEYRASQNQLHGIQANSGAPRELGSVLYGERLGRFRGAFVRTLMNLLFVGSRLLTFCVRSEYVDIMLPVSRSQARITICNM